MKPTQNSPSPKALVIQEALNKAIAEDLKKKRRLGHYVVFWEDGKIVYRGDDAPQMERKQDWLAG